MCVYYRVSGISYCVPFTSLQKSTNIPLCCIDICWDLIERTEAAEAHGKGSSSYQCPFAHRDTHVRSQLCILQIKSNSLRALNSSFIWRMYSEQSTNMSLRKALHSLKKKHHPTHTHQSFAFLFFLVQEELCLITGSAYLSISLPALQGLPEKHRAALVASVLWG